MLPVPRLRDSLLRGCCLFLSFTENMEESKSLMILELGLRQHGSRLTFFIPRWTPDSYFLIKVCVSLGAGVCCIRWNARDTWLGPTLKDLPNFV